MDEVSTDHTQDQKDIRDTILELLNKYCATEEADDVMKYGSTDWIINVGGKRVSK